MDMSKAFISGAKQHLPNAKISFDPFHVVAIASHAVDQVRRKEVKTEPMLRKQRFSLLKDPRKLNERQTDFLHALQASHLDTARAWRIKEALHDIVRDKDEATVTRAKLNKLTGWMQRCRLEPMVRLGRTIKEHMDGIVRAISERRTNGFAEGLNSAIQAAKSRARGFKSPINFICIIYLIAGKLNHLPANPMRPAST
jgi:transposase